MSDHVTRVALTSLALAAVVVFSLSVLLGSPDDAGVVESDSSTEIESDPAPAVESDTSNTGDAGGEPSVEETTAAAGTVSLDTVAAVLCDDAPTQMSGDAELYTDSSYNCTHAGEAVRIDFYESADQQATANQALRDFYASTGDSRELSELPIGCGDLWGFGVDFNETRDSLIEALSQAGIAAELC